MLFSRKKYLYFVFVLLELNKKINGKPTHISSNQFRHFGIFDHIRSLLPYHRKRNLPDSLA